MKVDCTSRTFSFGVACSSWMSFPLSAVDAEVQDYGLQFHSLLSHVWPSGAGSPDSKKVLPGRRVHQSNLFKEVTKPLLEEKIAHMVLTFHIVSKITQHMQLPAQCRLCGSRVHYWMFLWLWWATWAHNLWLKHCVASCGVFLSQGKYRSASRARVVFSVNMIQPVESEEWQELSPQQTCQCFLSVPQIRVHSHWTFPHWHRCNYAQVQMCVQGMQALSFSHKCFQSFSKVKLEPAMRVSEHIRPTANLEAVESTTTD